MAALAGCASAPPADRPLGSPAPTGVLDEDARDWVEETLAGLDLREKAAQLTATWIPGAYAAIDSEDFEALARLVDLGIGGFTISIGPPHAYAAKLNALQARARVPLLITADFESGGPGMRMNGMWALPSLLDVGGGTQLPPTMAFGTIGDARFAREAGRITAAEARAVGVHLTFAPVLDVNSDPGNPIINTRAFGEDPDEVGRLAAAYIEGAHAGGLLTTGKHFPGHGDTRVDSHIELPVVDADRARLDSVELVPFRRAVEAGVDAIMSAHIAAPRILGEGAPPATLSPYFLTALLREEMGFEGAIYTDAMTMGAIQETYGTEEAAVRALEAGADVVLSPPDVEAAVAAIADAVREGRLTEARLDASVRRVLELKARAGLHRGRRVDIEVVDRIVGSRTHRAFADTAASRSLVLVRDREGRIPLAAAEGAGEEPADGPADGAARERAGGEPGEAAGGGAEGAAGEGAEVGAAGAGPRVLALTYAPDANLPAGRAFDRALAGGVGRLDRARTAPGTGSAVYDSLLARADSADLVLVSMYVRPRAGAGDVDVSDELVCFLGGLRDAAAPVAVLSFGNPYLLSRFPWVRTYLLAWDGSETMQRAAARAVLGEAPIGGRLPISLPPWHRRGEGLDRPTPPVPVQGPREGPAVPAGLDPARLSRLDRLVRTAVADGVTPGAAVAVGRSRGAVRLLGYGRLDRAAGAAPATDSSLYDLASLTKPLATATAVLLLAADGRLGLDDPVGRWLPGWDGGWRRDVTVRRLLLHRGGLPAWRPLWRELEGREAYRRALAGMEPAYPPGDSTVYSDLGYVALGLVAEAAAGEPLDRFLGRRVFAPLGLRETGFNPPPRIRGRTAPTEVDTVLGRGHVRGVVHDENAFALGGVAGHAGLFSSARDLAVLARAWLRAARTASCGPAPVDVAARTARPEGAPAAAGAGDPVPVLGAVPDSLLCAFVVPAAADRRDAGAGARLIPERVLAWQAPSPGGSAGALLSPRAFGHTGFTGTSLWIDPGLDLFVVLLTNRVNPSREERGHVPLRREVHDAAARAAGVRPRPAETRPDCAGPPGEEEAPAAPGTPREPEAPAKPELPGPRPPGEVR